MKILRVAPDLYPNVVGGLGIHVHEMSREQTKLGHDVTVYTATEGSESTYETADGYNVRSFKPFVKILGNSIMPNLFFDLVKKQSNYDIIHAHSHLYFSTNLCAVARQLSSSPLVITNHGLNSQTAPKWFQDIYTATGARLTFAAADKIICYTETEKKELVDLGIKFGKIEVIHNGINTDLFVPASEPCYNKKRLLWIGRYAKGKGVDYLVDAFRILKEKYPDVSLTMVGRGPDKDRIVQKIHALDLAGSIILKDFVPNSEIVDLYQNSSIFVLPSLEEGVPRTILEAMSCGIPVVCSRLPQLVDIVNGGGFLVPVKDSQTLADRILEVFSDPALAEKLGENGRKKVVENFSWKDTVKETIRLYEGLV
ncbi:glycosyltransferase family 4 protein [Methanosarcina sp. Mfa9]|uniref:glycosyltransferase family 4 protein n=1 Tax=Methanosarcina sp. Mfa9 TaxID=3439063 RepID=UPI003F84E61E